MAVQSCLEMLEIPYINIELGRFELANALTNEQNKNLISALEYYQLELMDDKKMILVERIKTQILEMVHSENVAPPLKFTAYLSNALGYDYTYLSNMFSEEEEQTIERFYILSRIERVKELIIYEEKTIKEIAHELNYSSVSHLCLQFKKVTGETPSRFKKIWQAPPHIWKKM
jgi:AraC-like DNA-binding protein